MNVDNNVFEGMTIKGRPRFVFSRGRKVADGNAFTGQKGAGKFYKSDRFYPVAL
jgi:dihydroorotase-like cyclic amidohydrolase